MKRVPILLIYFIYIYIIALYSARFFICMCVFCFISVDVEEEVDGTDVESIGRRSASPSPRKTRNYSGKHCTYKDVVSFAYVSNAC